MDEVVLADADVVSDRSVSATCCQAGLLDIVVVLERDPSFCLVACCDIGGGARPAPLAFLILVVVLLELHLNAREHARPQADERDPVLSDDASEELGTAESRHRRDEVDG